jgi:RNA polymerase sigma-70 factor, ECF subfamily
MSGEQHEEGSPVPAAFSERPSDRSLLRRLCGGDEEAATQLYHKYARRLHALVSARCSSHLASRLDPEDIVQSVFRSFFRVANTGVYDVPAGEDLWRLLLTIALNKVRAQGVFHRAAKRDVGVTTSLDAEGVGVYLHARQDDQEDAFLRMALEEALAGLPAQQRVMVELRLQGHDVNTISQQTGRAKRTVERNLQQALARLSALFEED